MKLKYYLRGLGIGIIVTAVIMGVSDSKGQAQITDAQIVARAKELGMVDGVLSQLEETKEPEEEKPETVELEAEKSAESEKELEPEKALESEKEPEPEKASKSEEKSEKVELEQKEEKPEVEKPEQAEASEPAEETAEQEVVKKIVVTVYPGEGSYTVSRKLAALGLVESADIYDKFLCQNGYDKKIITGNHEIEAGMSAEEIAKALTRR